MLTHAQSNANYYGIEKLCVVFVEKEIQVCVLCSYDLAVVIAMSVCPALQDLM